MRPSLNANKTHIVHLSTEMSMGGGERQILYLYQGLEKKHITQTILCSCESDLEAYCQQHHYSYLSLKKPSSFSLRYIWTLKKILQSIHEKHSRFLIHCHDARAHTYAIFADIFLWPRMALPIIVSKKVLPSTKTTLGHYFKYRYPRIQKFICVSQATANICLKWAPPHKIFVLHDTVICQDYGAPKPHKIFTIAFIGSLISLKDPEFFIQCAQKLLKHYVPIQFWIIGEGPERENIEKKITQHHLQSSITLLGYRKDIPSLLSQIDILWITSKSEGLCSTILQAMAAQVSIIARKVGGIPEIVQHQKTGLLAKTVDDFVDQTLQLYHNPDLKKHLSTNAFLSVKTYNLPHFIEKILKLYDMTA